MPGLIIFIIIVLLAVSYYAENRRRSKQKAMLPANFRELLLQHILYYRSLKASDKIRFEEKIKEFLSYVNIHGVNTQVNPLDKLLIASSAVIPAFGFESWHYYNLHDILLYGDSFARENFSTDTGTQNTSGMVGTGALQRMMILSKPALHAGFLDVTGKHNTGIHEFVHLLDKADGETDGVPEHLLGKELITEWVNVVNEEMEKIMNGRSDINPYGATNKTEFFAVASEYFFQRPDLFKENHPQLFALMEKIFRQSPSYSQAAPSF